MGGVLHVVCVCVCVCVCVWTSLHNRHDLFKIGMTYLKVPAACKPEPLVHNRSCVSSTLHHCCLALALFLCVCVCVCVFDDRRWLTTFHPVSF